MRIGLTGGIASGKSTAARELARLGAVIIDADAVAREVVASGTVGLTRLVERFGERILNPDGTLDRPALGHIVYADSQARADLNAIIHPLVRARRAELEAAAPAGSIVVHDIPLLVETGQQDQFDAVIVVDLPVTAQVARVMKRDGLTEAAARQRIAAQASREERLRAATYVINTDQPKDQTRRQLRELWATLSALATSGRSSSGPSQTE